VIRIIPIKPPGLVHILQSPVFLCIFSNQSEGGKIKGKITVKIVKLIVGAERASIADFMATRFIID
jgi:uncharacterized protein (UPF0216 family)